MPILPPVPFGKISLAASWFRSIRDRIEEVKPVAGENITLKQTTEGIIISSTGGGEKYELNVCIDGLPGTLIVYGPKGQ
jgi:hypothetical protein